MRDVRQFLVGEWVESTRWTPVRSPAGGEQVARRREATPGQVERALEAAAAGSALARRSTRRARARLLASVAGRLSARRAELARVLVEEAGLPLTLAGAEVDRAAQIFTIAGEESQRLGRGALPRGPVLAFPPINSALEHVAREVAPALAAGACVIVRPPPQAPSAAQIVAEAFADSAAEASDAEGALPLSALQILNAADDVAALAVSDPRVAVLTFSGTEKAGLFLRAQSVAEEVILDIHGESAVIVARDADPALAAARCAFGAFAFAGQTRGSVRRVCVARELSDAFLDALLTETAKFSVGDPARPDIFLGPLIDDAAVQAAEAWLKVAVDAGAELKTGGRRAGRAIEPVILLAGASSSEACRAAIAAPILVVETCRDADAAIAAISRLRTRQLGLFSDSASLIHRAQEELSVRDLALNDVPTFRSASLRLIRELIFQVSFDHPDGPPPLTV